MTACVTELNDWEEDENHFTVISDIAINIKNAEIYRNSSQGQGPEEELCEPERKNQWLALKMQNRATLTSQRTTFLDAVSSFPRVDSWLPQEDKQIPEKPSTSCVTEPLLLVEHIRCTLMFFKKTPVSN